MGRSRDPAPDSLAAQQHAHGGAHALLHQPAHGGQQQPSLRAEVPLSCPPRHCSCAHVAAAPAWQEGGRRGKKHGRIVQQFHRLHMASQVLPMQRHQRRDPPAATFSMRLPAPRAKVLDHVTVPAPTGATDTWTGIKRWASRASSPRPLPCAVDQPAPTCTSARGCMLPLHRCLCRAGMLPGRCAHRWTAGEGQGSGCAAACTEAQGGGSTASGTLMIAFFEASAALHSRMHEDWTPSRPARPACTARKRSGRDGEGDRCRGSSGCLCAPAQPPADNMPRATPVLQNGTPV